MKPTNWHPRCVRESLEVGQARKIWKNLLYRHPAHTARRWRDFTLFLADLGPRPSSMHGLIRRDESGVFNAANCLWATRNEERALRRQIATDKATFAETTRFLTASGDFNWDAWHKAGEPD